MSPSLPHPSRRQLLGGLAAGAAALVLPVALGAASPARAQEPPPNPSDDALLEGAQAVSAAEQDVARLASELAAATAAVDAAQVEAGLRLDEVTAAETARDAARALATAAAEQAAAARQAQGAAQALTEQAQEELDGFVAASFRQGSVAGSTSGFIGVEDPRDVLDRAELLAALGNDQQQALDGLGRAQVRQANADARAREALELAEARRVAAEVATEQARSAYDDSVDAAAQATTASNALLSTQDGIRTRLDAARGALATLDGQRRTYQDYLVAKAAAEEKARREAAAAAAAAREQAAAQARAQARASAASAARSAGSSAPAVVAAAAVAAPQVQVRAPSASGTVAPAQGRLSSGFGPRWGTVHYGQDIAAGTGAPIVAAQAGTVISAGPASGFGLWVRVRHDDGTVTVYGHNDYNTVTVGQRVAAGEQIAAIGNRGESTGPHVHFEVALGGTQKVDPLIWLRSRGVAI